MSSVIERHGIICLTSVGIESDDKHHLVTVSAFAHGVIYLLDIIGRCHTVVVDRQDDEIVLDAVVLETAVGEFADRDAARDFETTGRLFVDSLERRAERRRVVGTRDTGVARAVAQGDDSAFFFVSVCVITLSTGSHPLF